MVDCPRCNQQFHKSGLYGHLRFSHELSGEELKAAFSKAKDQAAENQPPSATEANSEADSRSNRAPSLEELDEMESGDESPSDSDDSEEVTESARARDARDPVEQTLERFRVARERRRAVEEAMEEDEDLLPIGDPAPANETWNELLERTKAEEKEAENELRKAVEHTEVERQS